MELHQCPYGKATEPVPQPDSSVPRMTHYHAADSADSGNSGQSRTTAAVAVVAVQVSCDARAPYSIGASYWLMASVTRLNPCGPRFPLPSDAVCAEFVGTSLR